MRKPSDFHKENGLLLQNQSEITPFQVSGHVRIPKDADMDSLAFTARAKASNLLRPGYCQRGMAAVAFKK